MIDGIGKTGSGRLELVRGSVERSEAPGRSGGAAPERQVSLAPNPAAEMAASGPPVDAGKVAAIRAAIAEGRYPVDHDRIAGAMLALDLPERDGE
jgi:negative regulator of flagellin synthesis FlgM